MNDESVRDLKHRTKEFALRVIRLFSALPKTIEAQIIGKQVLRSGTSVGAQYREACRARSNAEFVSKMQSGLQELDETSYWLELLIEGDLVKADRHRDLQDEANQLTAIFVSSVKTAKSRNN
jgi:four helix bundle protein